MTAQIIRADATAGALMTLEMHLTELRSRLLRVFTCLAVNALISIFLAPKVLELLKRPLGNVELQALSIEEPVFVLIKLTLVVASVLTIPVIVWEAANFLLPALTKPERKLLLSVWLVSPVLFCSGAFFAYAVMLPAMFKFFSSFGAGYASLRPHMDSYVGMVGSSILILGLTFELPVVAIVLGHFQLITYRTILKYWRQAIVGSAALAALVTPDPTAISMLLVMGALLTLYIFAAALLLLFQEIPRKLLAAESR